MSRYFQLVFLGIFASMSFCLTGQVSFVAQTDAKQVVTDQYFTIKFTLKNANGANFKPPSFEGFQVVGGPSQSQMRSNVNGKVTFEVSIGYTLVAKKTGKLKIGPATINAEGQSYKSQVVNIEVVKAKANASSDSNNPNFIIEASLDHDTGYVGQQITLKYTLFTNQNVRNVDFTALPNFDGFFAQELNNYRSPTEQIVRDGVQYYKRVVKVIALFPQQRGKFQLDPAQVVLGVSDGRSSNFFFNTRLKRYNARSEGLTVQILESPLDAPVSYSGAIGNFFMGTSIDKKTVSLDDAITLTLQVKGDGDGKFIQPPEQPYTDLFDIYDPNLLGEQTQVVDDKIQVIKTYEYLMIPKRMGVIKFNPEMTYFNVDSAKYEKIYGQQYQVRVVKGSDREIADIDKEEILLTPPKAIDRLYSKDKHFAFSWTHIGLNGGLLCGLVGLLFAFKIKVDRDNEDPFAKRSRIAKAIAVSKLSKAKEALDDGDIKEYYIRLRTALQEYLADKTNQPSSQLSKEHISSLLYEFDLEDQLDSLMLILKKGEQAIYASIAPGQELDDYHKSLDIVSSVEFKLK